MRSLDVYAPICRYIVMPLWARWERTNYLRWLEVQEAFQYFPYERIEEHYVESIKRILFHAYTNCEFYKAFYSSHGFDPKDFMALSDIKKVPILKKDMIRNHLNEMIAKNIKPSLLIPGKTSGSTGKPLEFYTDFESAQIQRATALLTNGWAGYRLGRRLFTMFGRSAVESNVSKYRVWIRRKLLDRTVNLSTLMMTEENMLRFFNRLKKVHEPFLQGYAHTLHLFAQFVEGLGSEKIKCAGIISGGMPLYDRQREKIEDVFQCKVLNRYGSEELGTIACECDRQRGLHINAFSKYVEILDDENRPAIEGQTGKLIVTDLTNFGMPLIRYENDDLASFTHDKCTCGRGLPLIKSIEGRDSDFVLRPDGVRVSGISLTDNFGANIPGVNQIQILQDKLDHIYLRIVKNDLFSENSLVKIEVLKKEFFGEDMQYDIVFLDEIPYERSGKVRFVISKLRPPSFS